MFPIPRSVYIRGAAIWALFLIVVLFVAALIVAHYKLEHEIAEERAAAQCPPCPPCSAEKGARE